MLPGTAEDAASDSGSSRTESSGTGSVSSRTSSVAEPETAEVSAGVSPDSPLSAAETAASDEAAGKASSSGFRTFFHGSNVFGRAVPHGAFRRLRAFFRHVDTRAAQAVKQRSSYRFPPRCDPPCSPVSPDATVPHPQRKNAPHGCYPPGRDSLSTTRLPGSSDGSLTVSHTDTRELTCRASDRISATRSASSGLTLTEKERLSSSALML